MRQGRQVYECLQYFKTSVGPQLSVWCPFSFVRWIQTILVTACAPLQDIFFAGGCHPMVSHNHRKQ